MTARLIDIKLIVNKGGVIRVPSATTELLRRGIGAIVFLDAALLIPAEGVASKVTVARVEVLLDLGKGFGVGL